MVTECLIRRLLIVLLVLGVLPIADAKHKILPLHVDASVSTQPGKSSWNTPIKGAGGAEVYVLSLEPDFDVGDNIVTVELVLRRAGSLSDAPNLLDPTGSRHGLQMYDFAANDLAKGPEASVFGAKRVVVLDRFGLVVTAEILSATVKQVSSGNYRLDRLDLQIEVNNAKSRKGDAQSGVSVNGTQILGSVQYSPFGPISAWTWGNWTQTIRSSAPAPRRIPFMMMAASPAAATIRSTATASCPVRRPSRSVLRATNSAVPLARCRKATPATRRET